MAPALRYLSFCVLILIFGHELHAQREANIWYFGRNLGLDFNSGTAVPLNDGMLNTTEGVASISDASGNLLFYTDGVTIFNRLHQVMPNGSGLFGHFSSTQSAVVVPKIGDPNRFYVFTVDQVAGPRGLTYSIVNMLLDNGKGDVELKNVPLQSNVAEKVTAVKHCNNRDIWVLAHGVANDIYYAFLVSPSGIAATPVVSHTGTVLPGVVPPSSIDSSTLGYMKASPDGSRIAAAHWTENADVSDFNNASGVVSNTVSLFLPSEPQYLVYGIEFSPNNNLVYTTVFYTNPLNAQKRNELYQYDVSLPTPAAIIASKQIISSNSDPIQTYAALQVAPDGKMYMAKNTYKHIAAINSPNVYGAGCNYVSNAVAWTLPIQSSSFGLPTFIQSYFYPPDSFTYVRNCPGITINFNYVQPATVSSVKWNFNDPASGAANTSLITNPVHHFSAPGTYIVEMVKFTNCGPDTLRKTIITDTLFNNLGADTIVCGGTTVLLNPSGAGSNNSYLWQNGSTSPTLLATTPGLYWVETTNSLGCIKRDSIQVDFKPSPAFNFGPDTSLCLQQVLTLAPQVSNPNGFLWNTGATSSTLSVSQVGLYWCEVIKDGCKFRDSISVLSIKPSPVVDLGADQSLCEGITATLNATYPGAAYIWQDVSTNAIYTVTQSGTYFVELNLNGCKDADTVQVTYIPKPSFTLGPDQFICPGNTITLNPLLDPSWQLDWQDGSSASTFTLAQPGTYTLDATNNCGTTTDEIVIGKGVCKVFVPTGFTPNNDGRNDYFRVLGTETVNQFQLRVFNRWGEIVFQTTDKAKGWDGKWKGALMDSGVFVFTLQYTDINSPTPQFQKGTLTLIR